MIDHSQTLASDLHLSRMVRLIGFFLSAMVAIGAIVSIMEFREREIEDWQRQTTELSLMMAENVGQQMSTAYLALDSVAEKIQDFATVDSDYLRQKLRTPDFYQLLVDKARSTPQIEVIGVLDENGHLINYSRGYPAPDHDLSARDYFQAQKNNPRLGVFVSEPVRNLSNGGWTFFISRRLTGSDGEFMGVVQLGISPSYYVDFFSRVSIAETSSVKMYRDDFSLLASWPITDQLMGKKILDDSAYAVIHQRKKNSGVEIMTVTEKNDAGNTIHRMGAVRKVENYPLIINLMVDEEVYLADWRKNASVITVIAVGSIGVVILSFSLLAAMLRRREDNLKVTTELKQRAELANQQQAVLLDNLTRQQLVLKEISDRLEATFQNAADGIIMSDENGDIEAFNPAAEIIYGYTQAEVLHKHSKIFTPPGAENIWTIVSQSEEFRTTGKIHLEAERMRKDGSLFIAEMAVSEYALSDKRKLIIIVRDITARRKMEKLKNEFISTVSHELRTPLTAIRGALGLVVGGATGELPDKCMSMIRIAHQNSEGLTRLINDLLDIQRLEIGKMTYVFEVFAVQDLLATAVQSNVTVATNLGVKLALIGAPSKEKILVDAGRFQQVMANLISNACKYAPKESSVTIQTQHEIPGIVRIEVSDEGVGIPEDFQERIFQKFSQADSSDTRAKGGTGLGLSITQALVKQMHGEIGYFTTPGYGTTFYVDFPVSK